MYLVRFLYFNAMHIWYSELTDFIIFMNRNIRILLLHQHTESCTCGHSLNINICMS